MENAPKFLVCLTSLRLLALKGWNEISQCMTLREKCSNVELFLGKDTSYLSVFSPNAGKYGPEITQYLDTFHAVWMIERMMKFVYVVLDKILFQEI